MLSLESHICNVLITNITEVHDFLYMRHVRFHYVVIVFSGRFLQFNIEAARICTEHKTPLLFVRTQFDIDLQSHIKDKQDELVAAGKSDIGVIARDLRQNLQQEFKNALSGSGIFSTF